MTKNFAIKTTIALRTYTSERTQVCVNVSRVACVRICA